MGRLLPWPTFFGVANLLPQLTVEVVQGHMLAEDGSRSGVLYSPIRLADLRGKQLLAGPEIVLAGLFLQHLQLFLGLLYELVVALQEFLNELRCVGNLVRLWLIPFLNHKPNIPAVSLPVQVVEDVIVAVPRNLLRPKLFPTNILLRNFGLKRAFLFLFEVLLLLEILQLLQLLLLALECPTRRLRILLAVGQYLVGVLIDVGCECHLVLLLLAQFVLEPLLLLHLTHQVVLVLVVEPLSRHLELGGWIRRRTGKGIDGRCHLSTARAAGLE